MKATSPPRCGDFPERVEINKGTFFRDKPTVSVPEMGVVGGIAADKYRFIACCYIHGCC